MANIKLIDAQGDERTYNGVAKVKIPLADGTGNATFIQPAGKKELTGTNEVDVTNFATAQVVDENLVAENIKSGVSILGVKGTATPEWDGSFTKTRDLTGTTWEIASGWHTEANQGRYDILGEIADVDGHTTIAIDSLHLGWFAPTSGTPSPQANSIVVTSADDGMPYSLSNSSGFTLKITGGEDASNADLIAWINERADTVVEITYKGETISLFAGQTARLHNADGSDFGFTEDLVIKANEVETETIVDSPLPIEISTEAEMTALLETAEVGSVYKYTGETGTYENGALYVVEEEAVTLISFTIDGTTYYSPEGWTWEQWGADETYTKGDYDVLGNVYVYESNTRTFVTDKPDGSGNYVKRTELITAGHAYGSVPMGN